MHTEIERTPTYAVQAESLLGTHAFYDDERESPLRNGKLKFTAESAGMRGLLYVQTLRLMAQAVSERNFNERRTNVLRPSHLGRFALEHLPEVLDIARQLAVINTAEHTLAEQEDTFLGGLRVHQQPYMRDIVAFMNEAPQKIEVSPALGIDHDVYMRGALVEAPTGLGKTVLMARALVALGVGKPIENIEHDQARVRALIIVPSQTIVEQMTGKIGDNTLRNFAPGIDVGGYYQFEKKPDADTVVITIDQFVENFRDGMLFGQRFDVCIIDEAHTMTQPLLQKALIEHWRNGPVIGFSATPEYSEHKDARKLLPHRIFHGDLLDFMESEDDILNAVQLFEVRVDYDRYIDDDLKKRYEHLTAAQIRQMILREASAEFLQTQVNEGRRGMVFCEQGGDEPSGNAITTAQRLAMMTKPDGSPVRVAVAGRLNNNKPITDPDSNVGIRKRYAAGKLDFIVTVEWGREGLNEDIDVVATVGTITSRHKFMQEIGRGTRLSKKFPVTTLVHIDTPTQNRKAQSLFGLFGFEEIEQGVIIGYKNPPKNDQSHGGEPRPPREKAGTPIENFPLRIQLLLGAIHTKTVGEALLHQDIHTPVPKEYKPYNEMKQDIPGPPVTIRKYLRDELGFRCIGRYEISSEGRPFMFYFEPAADTHLSQFRGVIARVDLQREFGGVDVTIVDAMAEEVGAEPLTWFYPDGKRIPHFKPEDAIKIREAFTRTPPAEPTDYTRGRIAAAAGLKDAKILERLLPAEKARVLRKRTTTANEKIRVLDHWEEKDALQIIARLKELNETRGVPLYLVSRELASRYVYSSRETLTDYADSIGQPAEIVRIGRSGRPPRCFTWEAIRRAAAEFGVRHNLNIDFGRLPIAFNDKDPAKLAYAEEVIAEFAALPPHNLRADQKKNPTK